VFQKYKPYLIGFLIAVIVLWLIAYVYFYWGWLGWAADGPVSSLEAFFLAGSWHRWVAGNAPPASSPIPPTEGVLAAGITTYRNHCAVCHGSPQGGVTELGRGFYPPAPQFAQQSSMLPENQVYWVVKHGIARSGMPSWKGVLSDADIWRVTMVVSRFANTERLWLPAQTAVVAPDGSETMASKPVAVGPPPVGARPLVTPARPVVAVPDRAPMATVTTRATDSTARPSAVVPRAPVARPRRRTADCPTYPDCAPLPKGVPASPYVY